MPTPPLQIHVACAYAPCQSTVSTALTFSAAAMTLKANHISVCICTYKRPQLLKRLLEKLRDQETGGLLTYSVVVTDNDGEQTGKAIILDFASTVAFPVRYCVESQQGIAHARNKAVANADGEFVAFIDDDEYPVNDWLLNLFQTARKFGADGVLGPVKRHFDEKPPEWIEKSSLYERPTYLTGYVLTWRQGRSGNLLFKSEMLSGEAEPFDPQFRTGEDQDFLRRMMEKGRTFVWCHEAAVYEVVPPSRWKRTFMLKRALLRGAMEPRVPTFGIRDVLKSAIAVPLYTLALPFTLLVGQHRFMTLLVKLCDHLGKLLATIGIHLVKEQYVTD